MSLSDFALYILGLRRLALISHNHLKFFEINCHFKRISACCEIASVLQTFCECYRTFA